MARHLMHRFLLVLFFMVFSSGAMAQNWIQVESNNSLAQTNINLRDYLEAFDDVHAFETSSGWSAIVLGPMTREAAVTRLTRLKRQRKVPRDAFVTDGSLFRRQVYPLSSDATAAAQITTETPQAEPSEVPADETVAQARRNQRNLSRSQKIAIQTALQWTGDYTAGIDGAFGRGTRGAIAAYQERRGDEPSGFLTTRQREALLGDYQAMRDRLGMEVIEETNAGISLQIPANMVRFDRYAPPFVHFAPAPGESLRLLLISQEGGLNTLFALYDILQTLEIVPLEGKRSKGKASFVLTGRNDQIRSYTYARHFNGTVKGFTLVWKPADDDLIRDLPETMRGTLASTGSFALDPALGPGAEDEDVDLMAGLEIRRPVASASGFYASGDGAVVTSTSVLQECSRITIDHDHDAELAYAEPGSGVAVLKPKSPLAPMAYARFSRDRPRLRDAVVLAGYTYAGRLGAPTISFGNYEDSKGLNGEDGLARLTIPAEDGDVGGPVLDKNGSVIGMLMARETGTRRLPGDVHFLAKGEVVQGALALAGLSPQTADFQNPLPDEEMFDLAGQITVLVDCWN